jgi:hypothetical protein
MLGDRFRHVRRIVVALVVATAAVALTLSLGGGQAAATPSSSLVVNEVYGGGGNSGAQYTNDFIEMANRGNTAASVDGWSVQYHSSGTSGAWQVTQLSGSIPAGGLYLVGESQGSGGTQPLPPRRPVDRSRCRPRPARSHSCMGPTL